MEVEVPHDQLEPATLRAVIEEFVTREGTDYGEQEFTLDQKVALVISQLKKRKAVIVFDQETESCHIVVRN